MTYSWHNLPWERIAPYLELAPANAAMALRPDTPTWLLPTLEAWAFTPMPVWHSEVSIAKQRFGNYVVWLSVPEKTPLMFSKCFDLWEEGVLAYKVIPAYTQAVAELAQLEKDFLSEPPPPMPQHMRGCGYENIGKRFPGLSLVYQLANNDPTKFEQVSAMPIEEAFALMAYRTAIAKCDYLASIKAEQQQKAK